MFNNSKNPIVAQLNKNGFGGNQFLNQGAFIGNGVNPNLGAVLPNVTMPNTYQPNTKLLGQAQATANNQNGSVIDENAFSKAVEYVKNSGVSAKQACMMLAQEKGFDMNGLLNEQLLKLLM